MRGIVDAGTLRDFRRHRAGPFRALDLAGGSITLRVLAAGASALIGLALAEGRALRPDGAGPSLLAFLATVTLLAALLVGLDEAATGLLARPVGRDVARAVAALDRARELLDGVPEPATGAVDAALLGRLVLCRRRLHSRLEELDDRMLGVARIPDRRSRTERLATTTDAAGGIGDVAFRLTLVGRSIAWVAGSAPGYLHAEVLTEIAGDLAEAERLETSLP